MKKKLSTFDEFEENYPCTKCTAPCCKNLIIPYKTPNSWMDLDFINYLLNFPNINVTVSKKGEWCILIQQDCQHFDPVAQECKVHNTAEQPKTCTYFNPYQCNYKLNLDDTEPQSIYILDRIKFDHWVQHIGFDTYGRIANAPSFEKAVEILRKIGGKKK